MRLIQFSIKIYIMIFESCALTERWVPDQFIWTDVQSLVNDAVKSTPLQPIRHRFASNYGSVQGQNPVNGPTFMIIIPLQFLST